MKDFKWKDVLISLLIVSVTFLYFMDKYLIPEDLKTISMFGFEIGSFGHDSLTHLFQFSKMKLLIISFTIIWYLTCRHWWKSSILVIIFIELHKLFSVLNSNQTNFDEIEYFISLPITIPIILLLFFISNKINNFNISKEIRLALDDEIDNEILKLGNIDNKKINTLKNNFNKLKEEKKNMPKEKYLSKLLSIRNEIYNKK